MKKLTINTRKKYIYQLWVAQAPKTGLNKQQTYQFLLLKENLLLPLLQSLSLRPQFDKLAIIYGG